jgi:hypothetical protein
VIALFDRIFGERALVHPMFVQRNIFPQSYVFDFTTGIHQDRVHIGGAIRDVDASGRLRARDGHTCGRGGVPHHEVLAQKRNARRKMG